jgi:hypothetical protein
LQDIGSVDFFLIGPSDGKGQRPSANFIKKLLSPLGGKFFRVVQSKNRVLRVENDGGGAHRAGQRASARFVHPAHRLKALLPA